MRRLTVSLLLLAAMAAGTGGLQVADPAPSTVEGLLYSTMPSESSHRPEMAMVGNAQTYFRLAYGMDDGDEFLLRLSQPVPVSTLRVTSGDTEGLNQLTHGFVETSPDGIHFSKAAHLNAQGIATHGFSGRLVQDLCIRLNPGESLSAIVLREITLTSTVPISHIALGPGRGFIDLSQAPDQAVWSQKAETQVEQSWTDTAALLYTDHFLPAAPYYPC